MQILIILLFILPFLYKSLFWLYTIQLKEYRWDRIREYSGTLQGRSAFFNFWFIIELPIFLFTFTVVLYDFNLWGVASKMIFYLLILENIYVIGKFMRGKNLLPKFTQRAFLLFISMILLVSIVLISTIKYDTIFNSIVLILLLFPYILYFITNFFLSPIVIVKKNNIIKSAIKKSKKINTPIKISITGSYGKSSVKEFLASILEQDGKTLKTPDNINSELGVSRLILRKLDNTYKYFVAEIGAYRVGEIKILGKIVNHKYGFLTAIGNQHLGLFGSIENTIKAKSEIIKKILKNSGILYANFDNINVQGIKYNKNLKLVKYGIDEKLLDAQSRNITIKNGITTFDFSYKDKITQFKTSLIGRHNILNLTGVLALSVDLGIDLKDLKKYLKKITPGGNILKIIKINKATVIDDSYNLSEEGLLAGLEILKSFEGNRILVLDDILELGEDAKKIHYKIGKKIAKLRIINKVLYVGVNYKRDFYNGLNDGGLDISNNILTSLDNISKGDILLLEGRGSKKIFKS